MPTNIYRDLYAVILDLPLFTKTDVISECHKHAIKNNINMDLTQFNNNYKKVFEGAITRLYNKGLIEKDSTSGIANKYKKSANFSNEEFNIYRFSWEKRDTKSKTNISQKSKTEQTKPKGALPLNEFPSRINILKNEINNIKKQYEENEDLLKGMNELLEKYPDMLDIILNDKPRILKQQEKLSRDLHTRTHVITLLKGEIKKPS